MIIDLPKLKTFSIGKGCFKKTRMVVLSDLPLVKVSVDSKEEPFQNISFFSERNVNQSLLKYIKM